MGTREQALENLKKAHESPDIGKRGPGQAVKDREEARKIYLQRLADELGELTDVQLKAAKKEDNAVERMYVLNQAVGKPVERVEVEQTTTLRVDV